MGSDTPHAGARRHALARAGTRMWAGILAAMALMSLFFSWNDPLGREVHWGPDAVTEV